MSPSPTLPDELILRILHYTPPTDLLTLLKTSHQLKRCASETILTQILPKITLSTMQWHPSCLNKQDYTFSHISDPTPESPSSPTQFSTPPQPLGPSLALSQALFSVSMHYAYHSGTPWFIGWGMDYDGEFKVVDGMGNSFGQVPLPEDWQVPSGFLLKDVLGNLPELGTGPWPETLGGREDEDEDEGSGSDADMDSDSHSDSNSEPVE